VRSDCTYQQAGTNQRYVTPSTSRDHFGRILNKSIDLHLLRGALLSVPGAAVQKKGATFYFKSTLLGTGVHYFCLYRGRRAGELTTRTHICCFILFHKTTVRCRYCSSTTSGWFLPIEWVGSIPTKSNPIF
jgi:hypothetical protein